MAAKNTALSLKLLSDQLRLGAEPLYLLTMIGRQIKILIKIKSAQHALATRSVQVLAREIGEHPFVVQKILPLSAKFQNKQLLLSYEKVLAADMALKSSRRSAKTLLTKLVCDLIS